jgi:translocation and assembly module TamA
MRWTTFGRRTGRRELRGVGALLAALLVTVPAIAEVAISGVDGPLGANVLAYLNLDEEPCDAPRWRVEQQYAAAPTRIRQALEALGYYEGKVVPTLDFTEECWHAAFAIEAGEPVLIRGFDVTLSGEALSDAAFAAVLEQSLLKPGAVLNHGAYEGIKRRWSDLASERGYVDAQFLENKIDVFPTERVADVILKFDSGSRYPFGTVVFRQDVLTERLVRSYVRFREGDPYDSRQLTALYVALGDSGYFRSIDVRPLEPDRERRAIPIQVVLTGAARRQISYGLGFSTDTGPRLRFGRNNRRFNDRGHQFGVNAQLSPVVSEVTANYRFPFGDPRSEWINFDAGLKSEDTDSAQSESLELGARRVLERPGNWTRTQMLSFLVEDFEVADQVGRSQLLMPGINWTRLRADNSIRPRAGSKLSLEVRAAADAVGSDTSFVQAVAQGKWIWSLRGGARLLLRGHVGATAERAFAQLPPSVRFFAGGDNSVRGYDFETLGPVDADGKVVGGSSLAAGSFEYEHPLRERWSLAVFVDSGNAFDGARIDAKTGAGFGGRWQSPLGPIRVDLAHPFDDSADSWRLHISLGPDL